MDDFLDIQEIIQNLDDFKKSKKIIQIWMILII